LIEGAARLGFLLRRCGQSDAVLYQSR
jgi:hypothetical protein